MKHPLRLTAVLAILAACGGSVDIEYGTSASGSTGTGASGSTGTGGASVGTGVGAGPITSSGVGAGTSSGGGTTSVTGTGGASTSTGSGTGNSGAGGTMTCADFGDPCTTCVSVACPAIYCAYVNNPECFPLSDCLNTCNDDACTQACQTMYPGGIADLYLVSDCAGTSCHSECPGNEPLDDCTKCVLDTCPEALNVCLAHPDCVALYECLTTCGDVDLTCQQGCYAQHGAGTMPLQTLLQCESMPCGAVCQ